MQSVNAGSLVVYKRDVQLCIIGVFSVWAAMFAISGCRSLLQSFENTFFELAIVENSRIIVGISTLSIVVPYISISGLSVYIAISGIGHCRNHFL